MEVTFMGWLKREGELVGEGEPVFELDTSKSTIEVEAFADGILADLRVQPGDVVEPRQVVAVLLDEGEALPASAARAGSGAFALATPAPAAAPTAEADGQPEHRERARRAVATMTQESWRAVPHFHLLLEADVTEALARLRPTAVVCRALALALDAHPECNLAWRGDELVQRESVDLGLLVDTPQGLLLPAVRDAVRLAPPALDSAIAAAAERARAGTLRPDDGGERSATVSNLGMFAVDQFTGVIAAPDVLLLTLGRARDLPRWREGEWERRSIVRLTLSADHRALDGADGGRLLDSLESLLASPERLS